MLRLSIFWAKNIDGETDKGTGDDPIQGDRTIQVTVTDANIIGGGNVRRAQSSTGTGKLFVDATDDGRAAKPNPLNLTYFENGAIKIGDGDYSLKDIDDENMTHVTVQITHRKI